MEKGYLSLVLHAHLPFIHHPEYDDFLEEDWLFEAITETYIPLIITFEKLIDEGIDFRVSMSITPPLCEMLANANLQKKYLRYINKLVELAEKEVARTTADQSHFGILTRQSAQMYEKHFKLVRTLFKDKYDNNILQAFKQLQDKGKLEILTCPATHGYLPLMETPEAIRAQMQVAVNNYQKHFGRKPKGMWLSECAYRPGLEDFMQEADIKYFILDAHGLLLGVPMPKYGVFAPVYTPAGVAAFGRDLESSKQVWSSEEGYPGDFIYREFYRDIGYDMDYDYIKPYLHNDAVRRNIGIKYHKITGKVDLSEKHLYVPSEAMEKAAEHAGNFMFNRQKQIEYLAGVFDKKPIIVSPYDAELFGHWWFEGPVFLEYLLRKIYFDQKDIKLITPSEYLRHHKQNQVIEPSMSSWGDKGYNEVWLNGTNDWVYKHLHRAEHRMVEVAKQFAHPTPLQKRALNQMARELLLAQSSDWAFIMTTRTAVAYAEKRTRDHLARLNGLYLQLKENRLEKEWLKELEWKDAIFQEIDYHVYA